MFSVRQIPNLQCESRGLFPFGCFFRFLINDCLCKSLVHTVSKKHGFHCVCVFELTG